MQERRKQPRKNLMSYSQVFDLSEGRLIGYLGDLNLSGAMVIGDRPMKLDFRIIYLNSTPRIAEYQHPEHGIARACRLV